MKLTVIGCSPAWPNPGGAQSGYLIEGPGSVLLDCGPGVLSRLRLGGGWPEPGAIALTHFHLDHCGDLIPWVWGAFYERDATDSRRRPDLWVPPGGRERLASIGTEFGFRQMFEEVFSIEEYEPGRPFTAGGQTLTALPVLHYRMDAYGFRVSSGGTTIAYSGDSGPGDHLVEVGRNADLFICEATLAAGVDEGEVRGHLTLEEAEGAFDASEARRLIVTHRPVELETPSRFELAQDGLVLEL